MKIGLFYSYNTKRSSEVALKIASYFDEKQIETVNLEDVDEAKFLAYDYMILSCPTWWDGELPNYWDEFMPAVEDMNLKGKTVAVFGLGDQKKYSENFCDAIGILTGELEKLGAKIVGSWPLDGYKFESSKAVQNGMFRGLPIDEDTQHKLTDERVKTWAAQVKKEFSI